MFNPFRRNSGVNGEPITGSPLSPLDSQRAALDAEEQRWLELFKTTIATDVILAGLADVNTRRQVLHPEAQNSEQ